jgi:nucleotide-binding universal stress UspA family protein
MPCKTLLVHVELNGDNEGLLRIAGDLAEQFKAKVIGIAACQPIRPLYEENLMAGEVLAQDRAEITKELAAAEAEFRAALANRAAALEWRTSITYASLAEYIAEEARAADLIITGRDIGGSLLDNTRRVRIGDLVMAAGKPVLIVPQGISSLPMNNVVLGWKETREARRAATDALPLLSRARHVTVLEVTPSEDTSHVRRRLGDVVTWLDWHGVSADARAVTNPAVDLFALRDVLREGKCDLLVAGAYGHSRIGEWVFGGVTRDLLLDPDFCVLISH